MHSHSHIINPRTTQQPIIQSQHTQTPKTWTLALLVLFPFSSVSSCLLPARCTLKERSMPPWLPFIHPQPQLASACSVTALVPPSRASLPYLIPSALQITSSTILSKPLLQKGWKLKEVVSLFVRSATRKIQSPSCVSAFPILITQGHFYNGPVERSQSIRATSGNTN